MLKYIWEQIKEYRLYYFFMLCAPILASFYKPVVYYAIKLIIDDISQNTTLHYSQLIKPILIYIAIDLSVSIVWRLSEIASYKSEPFVKRNILLSSLDRILSFNYSFFQNVSGGMITSKIRGILDGYSNIWNQLYYGLSFAALGALTIIGSIFLVDIRLGFILVIWSLIYILFNYQFIKKINRLSENQSLAKHEVISKVSDQVTNAQIIKSFSARHVEQKILNESIANDYIPKQITFTKFQVKINIFNDIMSLSIIIIMLCTMFYLRQHGLITIGSFVFIFGMVVQFQDSLWSLMQQIHLLSDQLGDFKSSLSINTASSSEYNGSPISLDKNLNYSITCQNIYFSYNDQQNLFTNLNLHIKPLERIGLVGYTGAGKTSLINLLLKNFTPISGTISLNETDINTLDNDAYRQLITVVPQDISLFHRSIIDNIRYAKLDATDDEVLHVAHVAHAHEFITQLPNGYNTLVGERGIKLSGGQRQRIAFARALLKNSPILILDEATSALDNITESYIRDSSSLLFKNKTVIAIAHRLTTLKHMDRIIVLDKGHIVEEGSHESLLKISNSLYSKIWASQIQ